MDTQDDKIYTIEDVARELGISKTTVSRAISGKGRVSELTRERVLDFIKEHDYRPSVLARGLAMNKTYNLAVVFPLDYRNTELYFFQECLDGCTEAAFENNYDILVTITGQQDLRHIQRLVTDRKVDGMILTRSTNDTVIQDFLKLKKVPFVLMGHSDDPDVVWIDNSNREACREMTDILFKKGMKSLALIGGDLSHTVTQNRYRGFMDACENSQAGRDDSLIFMGADSYEEIKRAVERSLEAGAECIVCMDDSIAYRVTYCLREMQVPAPERIKVASFYDSALMESCVPPVTSIKFDTKALVRNACRKLLKMLGEEPCGEEAPLTYQLIFRKSTQ